MLHAKSLGGDIRLNFVLQQQKTTSQNTNAFLESEPDQPLRGFPLLTQLRQDQTVTFCAFPQDIKGTKEAPAIVSVSNY